MSTKKYLGEKGTEEVFSKILNNQITGFRSAIGTGSSGYTCLLLHGTNKAGDSITDLQFELFNERDFNVDYNDQEDALQYYFWGSQKTINFRSKFISPKGLESELILGNGMFTSIDNLFKENAKKYLPDVTIGKNNDYSYSLKVDGVNKGPAIIIPKEVARPGFAIEGNATLTKDHQNSVLFVKSAGAINLDNIENMGSVSFRKVFDDTTQPIIFTCSGKDIIYTNIQVDNTSNKLSGKNGSTATISIYGRNCYIDIRNIK